MKLFVQVKCFFTKSYYIILYYSILQISNNILFSIIILENTGEIAKTTRYIWAITATILIVSRFLFKKEKPFYASIQNDVTLCNFYLIFREAKRVKTFIKLTCTIRIGTILFPNITVNNQYSECETISIIGWPANNIVHELRVGVTFSRVHVYQCFFKRMFFPIHIWS